MDVVERQRYCSTYCYHLASRKRIVIPCGNCGIEIEKKLYKYNVNKNHFCSKRCHGKFNQGENHRGWIGPQKVTCENCNKNFERPAAMKQKNRTFCSHNCYWEYAIGSNSSGWKGGIAAEPYCNMWLNKEYKEDIKKRDGNVCSNPVCYKTSNKLVIHHINYDKKDCTLKNLIAICNSCNSVANRQREWHMYWYSAILYQRYRIKNDPILHQLP
jgi:hypothetical protein